MNSKINKIIALFVCFSLITGSIGALAYNMGKNSSESQNQNLQSSNTETNTDTTAYKSNNNISKEETVYVMTDTDGSVKKIIVSDWIKNSENADKIYDKTNLVDIKNVKGDEKYVMNSDNMQVWDANGNDIYYQGTIDKEIPVNISVSYRLDGKDISAEELAGKSGRVTMRFDYENIQYEEVLINGQKQKIYVPFVMLTGTMLDNDVFTNVDISNGKIINDGDKTIVIGFALPGMQNNLGISKKDLDLPEYLEISADVQNFCLSTTLTVATNEMFNDIDVDKSDDIDDLIASMDDLTNAMNKLIDGSSALYDGVSLLLDKSDDLISGINQLSDGADKLKNGTESLEDGSNELYNGIDKLYGGLGELKSNNKDLNRGAKTVFETLLNAANTQIKQSGLEVEKLTISNYSKVINKAISSLDESKIRQMATSQAKEKVTEAVEQQRAYIKTQVEVAVRQKVLEGVLANLGYTYDQYKAAVENGLIDSTAQAQIDGAVENTMATSDITNRIKSATDEKINSLIDENLNSSDVKKQIEEAVNQAKEGIASLKTLKSQLDDYNKFYTGLLAYTNGVSDAYDGANSLKNGAYKLKNGTGDLNQGAAELFNGITSLKNGSQKLVSGVKELKDGSVKLSDGLKEFNENGIKKLTDIVNGDLSDIYERVKATINVSKNYQSFSGISDDMTGLTRFIYKSDAIETK